MESYVRPTVGTLTRQLWRITSYEFVLLRKKTGSGQRCEDWGSRLCICFYYDKVLINCFIYSRSGRSCSPNHELGDETLGGRHPVCKIFPGGRVPCSTIHKPPAPALGWRGRWRNSIHSPLSMLLSAKTRWPDSIYNNDNNIRRDGLSRANPQALTYCNRQEWFYFITVMI